MSLDAESGPAGPAGPAGQAQKVDLDNILIEELGQFGRHQLFTLLLMIGPVLAGAFTGEYVFTTARIPTRSIHII